METFAECELVRVGSRVALVQVRWSVAAAGAAWGLAGVLLWPERESAWVLLALALGLLVTFRLAG